PQLELARRHSKQFAMCRLFSGATAEIIAGGHLAPPGPLEHDASSTRCGERLDGSGSASSGGSPRLWLAPTDARMRRGRALPAMPGRVQCVTEIRATLARPVP